MVSTRNHPQAFSSPASASPTKASRSSSRLRSQWAHTPSNLTLIWLAISLPLVAWDIGYVFLRPHSMAGGKYQWPLWMPYAKYATVDYIYGWPAYEQRNGFTAAQSSLNVVETVGYLIYLWILYRHGTQETVKGTGAPAKDQVGWLAQSRTLYGRRAAYAVLLLYGMSLMTLSKTILYWLNEACGGFGNIGHNSIVSLIPLWIIPNGAWIVFPAYMLYVSGKEILQGLELATGESRKDQ